VERKQMIKNIQDLQKFVLKDAEDYDDPIFKNCHVMHSPGCSDREIKTLQAYIPHLPTSYLEIINRYDINGTYLGYFSISPSSSRKTNLIDKLIDANLEDPFFPKDFMTRYNMYQIGSNNTDLICVTSGTKEFKEGEVLYVEEGQDIYAPQENQIHKLAKDFEQFLIVAGNLNQVYREISEDESNYDQKRQEFLDRLKILGVHEEYWNTWLMLFD
jgi:hypothetical protein